MFIMNDLNEDFRSDAEKIVEAEGEYLELSSAEIKETLPFLKDGDSIITKDDRGNLVVFHFSNLTGAEEVDSETKSYLAAEPHHMARTPDEDKVSITLADKDFVEVKNHKDWMYSTTMGKLRKSGKVLLGKGVLGMGKKKFQIVGVMPSTESVDKFIEHVEDLGGQIKKTNLSTRTSVSETLK